jgi:hypothetical protein
MLDKAELDKRALKISEECEGIFPPNEAMYIHSIIYSAGRSNEAFNRFELGQTDKADDAFLVSSVHEALTHAAALSLFFWPSEFGSKKYKGLYTLRLRRAEKLRGAFNMEDGSALKDRNLRNTLEHFDENLDRFLLNR